MVHMALGFKQVKCKLIVVFLYSPPLYGRVNVFYCHFFLSLHFFAPVTKLMLITSGFAKGQ
jgi:hypothetical protein